ncbi:hypothetical protein [Streptomyces profundus]|uniref:hypothetical protein n=1 Tax=Streptomyces profundus TaxID=2867410 RepID=UPI001D1609F0|nr:hypothetical protein [Streptomyces sp. MA3_2.13]UED84557.1 hypothetical protein K4G22_10360 [Streptomyces sp. MA3_2.13]
MTNHPHPSNEPQPTNQPYTSQPHPNQQHGNEPRSTHEPYGADGLTPLERELAQQLRQAGVGYHRVPELLADAGLRRGRARLWRRRAATVTGALAVVGIAVAATQLPGGGSERFEDTPPAVASVPDSGSEMVETLEELLPEGLQVSGGDAVDVRSSGDPSVSVRISDGGASFELDVMMLRWETDDWRSFAGCGGFERDVVGRCADTELPDGSVQTIVETAWGGAEGVAGFDGDEDLDTSGDGASPQRGWDVWWEAPTGWGPGKDGLRQLSVSLRVDGPQALEADLVPLLSEEELIEIAHAPVWQEVFRLADEHHGAPGDSLDDEITSDVPTEDLHATFEMLVPEGLEVSERRGQYGGSASLVLTDGEVSAEVDITGYAPGSFDEGGEPDPECLNETLADSTTVSLCLVTGEPTDASSDGAPGIYADVYYPNGASIDILHTTTEGAEGPLSEEQILEIASAPEWQELLR